ncbi:MAG: DUF2334 domain-containing protein, partial [Actinomycetota bacterium]|nr:DUF2334 domain-containing protein [Actinomycetota bacterium]
MSARLLVSLSGIRLATLDSCQHLTAELDRRGVHTSLLVVPRAPGPVDWVRYRRAGGDAVLLHGYDHTADPIGAWGRHAVTRIGRRAEFAALPCHEAGLRLLAGDKLLEQLELRTDAFAPPRWLASPGTLEALRCAGFAVCADATMVHDLRAGVA